MQATYPTHQSPIGYRSAAPRVAVGLGVARGQRAAVRPLDGRRATAPVGGSGALPQQGPVGGLLVSGMRSRSITGGVLEFFDWMKPFRAAL